MLLIYLRYEKFFIRNKCTINFTESVKALSINSLNGVKSYIYIPPRIIKINSILGMVILNIFSFITVNYIAGDILTTTKRGKQMGKVITDSFSGFDCFMYIKILDYGSIIVVILEIMYHPFVYCFYLFFISITIDANFVSKCNSVRIPQGCLTIGKRYIILFVDENVC